MLEIKKLLKKSFERIGLKRSLEAYNILQLFDEIVRDVLPQDVYREIRPISFRDGVLKLQCSHPSFAMQFRSYEDLIKGRMNQTLGQMVLVDFLVLS